ncbi:unnamed protein product [Choristocarpus tenellus]
MWWGFNRRGDETGCMSNAIAGTEDTATTDNANLSRPSNSLPGFSSAAVATSVTPSAIPASTVEPNPPPKKDPPSEPVAAPQPSTQEVQPIRLPKKAHKRTSTTPAPAATARRQSSGSPASNMSSKDLGIDVHRASDRGNYKEVCKYVETGGDVNARDKSMWTPLHRSARKGHEDICAFLLRHGADVNLKTMEQWTPLHCACVGGHPAVVKELLCANPPPDLQAKTRLGQTSLYLAAYWGHVQSVREILAGGADIDIKDAHGRAPGEDFHETVAVSLKVAVLAALK